MKKISLENITDSLSRDEMKKIMAGSGGGGGFPCNLTVAACWRTGNTNNAKKKYETGDPTFNWTCC